MSFDSVAELARRIKIDRAREFGDDPDEDAADLHCIVVALRAGEQVAVVHAGPGPDGPRAAAYAATSLLRCDEIFVVSDSRMITRVPDEDLENIRQGDLEREWKAGRRENITEAMLIARIVRDGSATLATFPYVRDRKRIHWTEPMLPNDDDSQVGGPIVDWARDGWEWATRAWPEIENGLTLAALKSEMTPAEQSYHTDRGAARYVSEKTGGAVILTDGSVFVEGQEEETHGVQ